MQPPGRGVLLVIGSTHAVTREQRARLLRERDVTLIDDHTPRAAARLREVLDRGSHALMTASAAAVAAADASASAAAAAAARVAAGAGADVAAAAVAGDVTGAAADAAVGAVAHDVAGAAAPAVAGGAAGPADRAAAAMAHGMPLARAGYVMSGGDTATDVSLSMGITCLELRGEVANGIPWGVIRGGRANGLPLVLKSGGFGAPDALIAALDFLVSRASTSTTVSDIATDATVEVEVELEADAHARADADDAANAHS
jgi:uncharacterized protein YgbK (DUF1537 family)